MFAIRSTSIFINFRTTVGLLDYKEKIRLQLVLAL